MGVSALKYTWCTQILPTYVLQPLGPVSLPPACREVVLSGSNNDEPQK